MKLTCSQMDVLISFYIEGDLSSSLKKQVEEHINSCATCKAKFDIINSMIKDMRKGLDLEEQCVSTKTSSSQITHQYNLFKNNLSLYLDNELTSEENLKMKKIAINNKKARKDLEENYNIRKLMNESYTRALDDAKKDFSKNIMRQLQLEEEAVSGIHPAIKILFFSTIAVLLLTSFVLISLNM